MSFRFLHTSDLHLGKRFGNLPEDLRGRLREARHTVIDRLATQARAHKVTALLLAGDTFDTETPTPSLWRQALTAMGSYSDLSWVILPGNHDSLMAEDLWQNISNAKPDNVILTLNSEPLWLNPQVVILPAPCTVRRPGRDLTEYMDDLDTGAAIRIGLAHGAIQSFSEDSLKTDVIAPDRAQRARLDYLALGDWHGQIFVNDRTSYSGTPEPDRFKHNRPGTALIVSIDAPGAPPEITSVPTGQFEWRTLALDLLSGEDAPSALRERLPPPALRRQILLRVETSGRTNLPGRTALEAIVSEIAPEFAEMQLRTDALATDCTITDLDNLGATGALRQAADLLLTQSEDPHLASDHRARSRDALVRLFTYCEAIQA
jgi:DNA repair exonuclease SbcCD nuclease subunit